MIIFNLIYYLCLGILTILAPIVVYLVVKLLRRAIDPNILVLQSATWLCADKPLTSGINCLVFFNTKGDKSIEQELFQGIKETYLGITPKFKHFKTAIYLPSWYKRSVYDAFSPSEMASITPPKNLNAKSQKEVPFGEVDEIKNHKYFMATLTNRRTNAHPKQALRSPLATALKDLDFYWFGPSYDETTVPLLDLNLHFFFYELPKVKWFQLIEDPKYHSIQAKKELLGNFDKSWITGKNELENLASCIASTSFDPNLPLWNMHTIKKYHPDPSDQVLKEIEEIRNSEKLSIDEKIGKISEIVIRTEETVFFYRWHHSGGDGVSGIKLLLYLSKIPEDERRKLLQEVAAKKDVKIIEKAAREAEERKAHSKFALFSKKVLKNSKRLFWLAFAFLEATIRIILIKRDDWNLLYIDEPMNDPKFRMSWIDTPIQLDEIKKMAKTMSDYVSSDKFNLDGKKNSKKEKNADEHTKKFSVNDIMMALLSHSVSQQMSKLEFETFKKKRVPKSILQEKTEEDIYKAYQKISVLENPDKKFKSCLWADTRGGGFLKTIVTDFKSEELNSDIGALFVELPMAGKGLTAKFESLSSDKSLIKDSNKLRFDNFTRKLNRVKENTDKLKHSVDHLVSNFLLRILSLAPLPLFKILFNFAAFKCSVSMSNVPGPGYTLIHCRRTMDKINFTVPPQGMMPVFACLLSYNNKVFFSVAAAEEAVGKTFSRELVDLFESEVKFLMSYCKIYEKKQE